MSIAPFSTPPASPEGESRRTRLAVLSATVGIAATLLAYAASPGVRHAVGHAEHSVKHAVSHVFDHDDHLRARNRVRPAPVKRATQPTGSQAPAPHGRAKAGGG
jgi:hypothetical protein